MKLISILHLLPIHGLEIISRNLLQNIVVKMFADRHIQIGEDVLKYLTPRMERSFKFISDLVSKSDELALSQKKAVTVPIVRDALIALDSE